MKQHISHFYNALLEYYLLHQAWCETKFIKYRKKQTDSHKVCSKCPPLAQTQACKRVCRWSTASSISNWSKPSHTCSRRCHSSSVSSAKQHNHYITVKEYCVTESLHLLFWHAPLEVHSTINRHQPPQRAVLSQVDCFIQCEVVGSQISMDGVQPRDMGTPWWSLPVLWWRSR